MHVERVGTATAGLLDAMCARDFDQAANYLANDVRLRAVLPPRLLEASGRDDVMVSFRAWFENAETFRAIDRSHTTVAGRARITWRFEVSPHPGTQNPARHLIEQTLFCDEAHGSIVAIDLLCSGFRPSPQETGP